MSSYSAKMAPRKKFGYLPYLHVSDVKEIFPITNIISNGELKDISNKMLTKTENHCVNKTKFCA